MTRTLLPAAIMSSGSRPEPPNYPIRATFSSYYVRLSHVGTCKELGDG
jgi:hypothetical protein